MKNGGCEFEREQEGICVRLWRRKEKGKLCNCHFNLKKFKVLRTGNMKIFNGDQRMGER